MSRLPRREFLALAALAPAAGAGPDPIARIERSIIWNGRKDGGTWFHPRACAVPADPKPTLLMTCQTIGGSDYFGPVHWSESKDLGLRWSKPAPIPGMGRRRHPDGVEEGYCDVVPEYHARTDTVLAMGHNVYYKDGKLTRPSEMRWPVYVVRDRQGAWSEVRKLDWDNPEASAIYTTNCSQRVTLDNGDILVPMSYGPLGRTDRAVASVLCRFDGGRLRIVASGNEHRLASGRGLLEPSLASFDGLYYMTIRAEDGRGYVTTSRDGLEWDEKSPWLWDDGEPIGMSSTQQRWLPHRKGLYLAYTRKDTGNVNVMRWRAPLYLARVDPRRLSLIRETERVVFPLIGDGVRDAENVARMGNFHTTAVTEKLSILTVGETRPTGGWNGDTLLARIHWRG